MTGAIIIVGAEPPRSPSQPAVVPWHPSHFGMPLCCVEILGCSVVGRTIESLHKNGLDCVLALAERTYLSSGSSANQSGLAFRWVEDSWASAAAELQNFKNARVTTVALIRPSAYAEINFPEMLQYHHHQGALVTRAVSADRPLDIWILDAARVPADELVSALASEQCARYPVSEYVQFLDHPRDLRRLVIDSFDVANHLRPRAHEVRTGIWMGDGVEVSRGARIVAPAFLGRGSRIEEQCLITRCSNIESNCHVAYGTVVEDSTILPNTYVGIGLDISHSLVHGNTLLHLERGVSLQISDHGVIRPNRVLRKEQHTPSQAEPRLSGAH